MKIKKETPKILVIGSSSIDVFIETETFPKPNETIIAKKTSTFLGGKGANQAIGTSRLGANVYFIGIVGTDSLGLQIKRNLKDENIHTGFLFETEEEPTGNAYISSSPKGNTIIIDPAANYCLKPKHIALAEKHFEDADTVLLQLEIPLETIEYAVKMAKKYSLKIFLYASPGKKLSEELIEKTDFIILKTNDLNVVLGQNDKEVILRKFPNKVFLLDYLNNISFSNGDEIINVTNKISLHKMGLGDAFVSGFSVAISHGNSILESVNFGNKVAEKVSEKKDSQSGLPFLKDIL